MKIPIITLLVLFSLLGCNNAPSKDASNAALPHGETLASVALSAEDKAKLAGATGRKVSTLNLATIEQMFDEAVEQLHVFSFWTLDCKQCIAMNKQLQALALEHDIKLVLINLDSKKDLPKVNASIRENNLVAAAYQLEKSDQNWKDGFHKDWEGSLPAVFMVNEMDGIDMVFERDLADAELSAIIQSLSF